MKKNTRCCLLAIVALASGCATQNPSTEDRDLSDSIERKPYSKWDQNLEANIVDGKAFPSDYQGKTLRIWFDRAHINQGMDTLTRRFNQEKNASVLVEGNSLVTGGNPLKDITDKPDVVCLNHDRIPALAAQKVIQPIRPGRSVYEQHVGIGWSAMSDHDKIYGYPIATAVTGLFYNSNLLASPPASIDELEALHARLKQEKNIDALQFDYQNAYFSWPLIAAAPDGNRPYIYGRDADGEYDPSVVGVNHPAAVRGLDRLKRLIDQGILPASDKATYGAMEQAFNREQLAMMINGPWAIDNIISSGIPFSIAPLPKVNGAEPQPFVLIYGCMLTSNGQAELATDFLENYLLKAEALAAIDPNNSLGVSNNKDYFKQSYSKPYVRSMVQLTSSGRPMPDTDYMGLFWKNVGLAIRMTTSGKMGAEAALNRAAQEMKR